MVKESFTNIEEKLGRLTVDVTVRPAGVKDGQSYDAYGYLYILEPNAKDSTRIAVQLDKADALAAVTQEMPYLTGINVTCEKNANGKLYAIAIEPFDFDAE